MILYGYGLSSASYRVRIALALKNLPYTSIIKNLRAGEHRLADFLRINIQGFVPALGLDDGAVLTQSVAIMEYLDEIYPSPRLLPAEPLARARVRALTQSITSDLHPLNNLRVLRYLEGRLSLDKETRDTWYRHWVQVGFDALERWLIRDAATGRFCHGDSPTLADILSGAASVQCAPLRGRYESLSENSGDRRRMPGIGRVPDGRAASAARAVRRTRGSAAGSRTNSGEETAACCRDVHRSIRPTADRGAQMICPSPGLIRASPDSRPETCGASDQKLLINQPLLVKRAQQPRTAFHEDPSRTADHAADFFKNGRCRNLAGATPDHADLHGIGDLLFEQPLRALCRGHDHGGHLSGGEHRQPQVDRTSGRSRPRSAMPWVAEGAFQFAIFFSKLGTDALGRPNMPWIGIERAGTDNHGVCRGGATAP